MKIAKILFGTVAALMLAGCMTEEPIQKKSADPQISMINNSSYELSLLSSKSYINDNGFLTVSASAYLSRTSTFSWIFSGDSPVKVYYTFEWSNANGKVMAAPAREVSALPGSVLDFHSVAPCEKVVAFRLVISLKNQKEDKKCDKAPAKKCDKAPAKKCDKAPAKKCDKAPAKKCDKAPAKKCDKAPARKAAAPAVKKANVQPVSKLSTRQSSQKLTEPFN